MRFIQMIVLLLTSLTLLYAQETPSIPEKGKLHSSVTCIADATQNYALYLPKNYDPTKKWPVILGFSPAGRGDDPVKLCLEAAEKYGFIVIGSNNIRNGHSEPINKAYGIIKEEALTRYHADVKRFYGIGMSGGSRMALRFASVENNLFRGVIACAAFIDPKTTFKNQEIFIYGIVGDKDFNYLEYTRGVPLLEATQTPYWIETFAGDHQWPNKNKIHEAIEMFDYLATAKNTPESTTKAEAILKKQIEKIEKFIGQKNWLSAVATTKNLLRNFPNASLIEKVKKLQKQLEETPECQAEVKQEEEFLQNAILLRKIEDTPAYHEVFEKIKKQSQEKTRLGNLAQTTLVALSMSIKSSYQMIANDKTLAAERKGFYFEIAHLANPGDYRTPLLAAYFYALVQNKEKTLSCLKSTAELNYSETDALEKAVEFNFLKEDPEFQKIIQHIQENKTKTKK